MTRYVFVTGGVVSSIGKGITTASLGRLLRNRGFSVSMMKIDPYLNVDAGTMNPYQHGEVFVTDDRAETDLDLGHYERFVDVNLTRMSNVTTGLVYAAVIEKERRGEYLGGTVQVIPHITNEIKSRIRALAVESNPDVLIIEVGGTVGDIEGQPFLEAIRQFRKDVGPGHVLYVHVTLVPAVSPWGEVKTKPTQHSVMALREMGIQPDVLVCRSKAPLTREMKEKIALFCDVDVDAVIDAQDTQNIYEIPLRFEAGGFANLVIRRLGLESRLADLSQWEEMVRRIENPRYNVDLAIVGKYTENGDAYISVQEAVRHGGIANYARVNIRWVEAAEVTPATAPALLEGVDGIIVTGGFGSRGAEGKIAAIRYAREQRIPYLGLCLGLQMAVVEFARHVCGLQNANSTEFDEEAIRPTPHPVIHLMPSQETVRWKGGTMRLGSYPCRIREGTLAHRLYGVTEVGERHRHRYEVNNEYRQILYGHGMIFSGTSPDNVLVEMIELPSSVHPFFIASQFHPEFKSRPNRAHPLFRGLVEAMIAYREARLEAVPVSGNGQGLAVTGREG
ncbi:MAG: CTP synthase [Armatimonadetes bacterium]|nr:CTP synthase [Armatimonadota bacterium]